MMGLSKVIAAHLQSQRVRELALSTKFRTITITRNVVAYIPGDVGPLLVFIVYTIQAVAKRSDTLTANQVFTSLAITSLLTDPAKKLLSSLPTLASAMGCVDRIQEFLFSESPVRGDSLQESPLLDTRNYSDINLRDLSQIRIEDQVVVVDKASIRPAAGSDTTLHDIGFQVAKDTVTMIVGTVGFGKSTLLKTIIGKVECTLGHVLVQTKSMSYCSQSAWLPNATIRQIVYGVMEGDGIDMEWYETVLHACALDDDVSQLADGDDTPIGSRGVILSGGQRQCLSSEFNLTLQLETKLVVIGIIP
ncbi:MAG: hypothetical protein MMC33_008874 [Icmadophila ericetorum]|nr:hypothetical protein [Icmadophila ericetorum]